MIVKGLAFSRERSRGDLEGSRGCLQMSVVHGPECPHQRIKSEQPRFGSHADPSSRDADNVRGCTSKWDFSYNSDVGRQSAGWQSNRDSTYPFIMPLGA
jgi:hypothetical protein